MSVNCRGSAAFQAEQKLAGSQTSFIGVCLLACWGMIVLPSGAFAQRVAQRGNSSPAGQQGGTQTDDGIRQYRAAAALYDRGLYDLAIDEWKKFVESYPNHERNTHGRHYLGISYFQTSDHKSAAAQFTQVLAVRNFQLAEQATLYLGVSQLNLGRAGERGQLDQALSTLTSLTRNYPRGDFRAEGLYYLAEAQYENNAKSDAAASYARLIKDFANHSLAADAMYALGVTQEELNQPDAAERTFATFLQHFSDHDLATEVSMRRGEALFQKQDYAAAAKLFQAAAATPGFEFADHALVRQASCLARQEKYSDAAQLYAEVPRRFTKSEQIPFARLEGGKCYYLAGDFSSARRSLESIAATGGEVGAEAAHWVSQCHLREGNAAAALTVVEAALRNDPGKIAVDLMLDRADALYAMGDRRGEAMEAFAKIAEEYANHPAAEQAMYMASFSAHEAEKYRDAIRFSSAYLSKFPQGDLMADVLYVAAESQLQLRQFEQASDAYQELIDAFPRHAKIEDWKVRQALAVYAQDKPQQAVAVLEPLARTLQDSAKKAQAFYLLGASFNKLASSEKAIAALTSSLNADSNWRQAADARLELAAAYRVAGELSNAKAQLTELTRGQHDDERLAKAHYLLGEIAYDAQDYQTASGEYQLVINQWPRTTVAASALYGLAWTQFSARDFAGAEQTANRAIQSAADDEARNRARYVRGLARKSQSKFDEAIEDLQAFASSATNEAERLDALYELGRCLTSQEQFDDAKQVFASILKTNPNYSAADRVRYELAWSFKDAGNDEDAAKQFSTLVENNADSPLAPEALHNLGEYYYEQEDFKQAAAKYYSAEQKVKELVQANILTAERGQELGAKATHKLGWCYYRQDDFTNAEKTFAYQLRAYPSADLADDARFMQGECYFKQNNYEKALGILAKIEDVSNPQFVAFARFHAAQAANQLERYDAALAALSQSEDLFAEYDLAPEATFERGFALNYQGKPDEALAVFEQVTTMTNREVAARARFMVGEVYYAKREYQEAIRNFFRAAYGFGYPKWQAASHFEAGRCFEALNKPQEALESYREVVNNFAESDQASQAQDRIKALGG